MRLCVAKRKKRKQSKRLRPRLLLLRHRLPLRLPIQPPSWQSRPPSPIYLPMLHRLNKRMPMPLLQQMCLLRPLRLLRRPSPPNPWWLCGVTTVQAKRKQKLLAAETVAMHGATADPVTVVHAQVATAAQTVSVTEARVVLPAKVEISAKTEAHAWAIPPSALSEKPWSAPKCRCANWRRRPMAKR
jgi:hypothetical protein